MAAVQFCKTWVVEERRTLPDAHWVVALDRLSSNEAREVGQALSFALPERSFRWYDTLGGDVG